MNHLTILLKYRLQFLRCGAGFYSLPPQKALRACWCNYSRTPQWVTSSKLKQWLLLSIHMDIHYAMWAQRNISLIISLHTFPPKFYHKKLARIWDIWWISKSNISELGWIILWLPLSHSLALAGTYMELKHSLCQGKVFAKQVCLEICTLLPGLELDFQIHGIDEGSQK